MHWAHTRFWLRSPDQLLKRTWTFPSLSLLWPTGSPDRHGCTRDAISRMLMLMQTCWCNVRPTCKLEPSEAVTAGAAADSRLSWILAPASETPSYPVHSCRLGVLSSFCWIFRFCRLQSAFSDDRSKSTVHNTNCWSDTNSALISKLTKYHCLAFWSLVYS